MEELTAAYGGRILTTLESKENYKVRSCTQGLQLTPMFLMGKLADNSEMKTSVMHDGWWELDFSSSLGQ